MDIRKDAVKNTVKGGGNELPTALYDLASGIIRFIEAAEQTAVDKTANDKMTKDSSTGKSERGGGANEIK